MSPSRDEYLDLVAEVTEHDRRYYVEARPRISDEEYDRLYRALRDIEAEHPDWLVAWSPTRRVGHEPLGAFPKVVRDLPMLSLDNTYDEDELRAFHDRVARALDGETVDYVVEPKIDGVSIELVYRGGLFALGATRGDGRIGEDVTANLRTLRGLPLRLNRELDLTVRGEVYMRHADFARINAERIAAGEEPFKNARNTAAGSLKLLDPREVASRPLRAILYEAVDGADMGTSHHRVLERWPSSACRPRRTAAGSAAGTSCGRAVGEWEQRRPSCPTTPTAWSSRSTRSSSGARSAPPPSSRAGPSPTSSRPTRRSRWCAASRSTSAAPAWSRRWRCSIRSSCRAPR